MPPPPPCFHSFLLPLFLLLLLLLLLLPSPPPPPPPPHFLVKVDWGGLESLCWRPGGRPGNKMLWGTWCAEIRNTECMKMNWYIRPINIATPAQPGRLVFCFEPHYLKIWLTDCPLLYVRGPTSRMPSSVLDFLTVRLYTYLTLYLSHCTMGYVQDLPGGCQVLS